MNTPPPGYSGESMLQGGTTPIVPVMGGGRVTMALKQIRKKQSRRAKQNMNKSKKNKRVHRTSIEQEGGTNHYTLDEGNSVLQSLIYAKMTLHSVPNTHARQSDTEFAISIPTYLKKQSKKWIRKIGAPFIAYSALKSNIPTSDNIGCSTGIQQAAGKLVKYAPDRLCCVLPKETATIILLPPIKGDTNIFLRVASSIMKDLNSTPALKNRVYIFSPPFFGVDTSSNIAVFKEFLHYKTVVATAENQWKFYILTEHSLQNIEAAKLLYNKTSTGLSTDGALMTALEVASTTNKNEAGVALVTSLYSMLEPTYIIYPYALQIPIETVDTVGGTDKLTHAQYKTEIDTLDAALQTAKTAFAKAAELVRTAQTEFNDATTKAWNVMNSSSKTIGDFTAASNKVTAKDAEINAITLNINALAADSLESNNLKAQLAALNAEKEKLQANVKTLQSGKDTASEANMKAQKAASDAKASLKAATTTQTNKQQYLKGIMTQQDPIRKSIEAKKPTGAPDKTVIEKGGLLFSAATKNEPLLPAPYSGFDGAIKYVETSDENTARRSIAYRVDLTKKDPLLDSMDYKEYNLLEAPPMNQQTIYIFAFDKKVDTRDLKISDTLEAFTENPAASHTHVPGIPIIVGTQEFAIRASVPDVVDDWNNGIFTKDEVSYLNSMKLSPKILSLVFGDSWKAQLSDHLSMISRSKCFKDPRLLLHADCQQAQGFISQVLKYYMEHSNDIIKLEQQQRDANINALQRALDAQIKQFGTMNAPILESIFDPKEFIKAFFPGKGDKYLTSVGPIKVDRNLSSYIVSYSYEDKLQLADKQAIERGLSNTFTVTTLSEAIALTKTNGTYKWKFNDSVSEYKLTTFVRTFIPTFKVDESTSYSTESKNIVNIIHHGKLSTEDLALIQKGVQLMGEEKAIGKNIYEWKLNNSMSEQDIQAYLGTIANTNIYDISLIKNVEVEYYTITEYIPNIDLKENTLTKIFLMREVKNPAVDISASISMNLDSGLSTKMSISMLQDIYHTISEKINNPNRAVAAFKGKYAFSE